MMMKVEMRELSQYVGWLCIMFICQCYVVLDLTNSFLRFGWLVEVKRGVFGHMLLMRSDCECWCQSLRMQCL